MSDSRDAESPPSPSSGPGGPTQANQAPSTSLVHATDMSRTLGAGGRDFLSNVSHELNGIAAQTSSMFSGIFG